MVSNKLAERGGFKLARALFDLMAGKPIVIGRAAEAQIRLDDERVSKLHCRIEARNGRLLVTDLASTNGTFVAGQRVEQAELCAGDCFAVADNRFLVVETANGLTIEPLPEDQPARRTAPDMTERFHRLDGNADTSAVDPIPGYRVIERLPDTAAGRAYLTEHVPSGTRRLLRIVPFPESVREAVLFIREVEVGLKLKHPNVLETVDFGELAGLLYLVLEHVEGPSLEERVRASGPLSASEACSHLTALADALHLASERRLVLRGIRPANILVESGAPKLAPFGAAKAIADRSAVTLIGDLRGISAFAAPEVFADPVRADGRSDIFSLGATYYFALTGTMPFSGRSLPEIRRSVLTTEPPPIELLNPGIPRWLAEALRRMMRKDREERFQSAAELFDLLRRLEASAA